MDLNLETLTIQNPWWRGESLKFDPVLEQYAKNKLKPRPEALDRLDLGRPGICCLNGSRGLGKTTALKLIIRRLIEEKKIGPRQIFYYSCQNLDSFEQLNEMIKLFLNSADKKRLAYILIDEIAMLKNWRQGVNHLSRAGKFKKTCLILASSYLGNHKNQSLKADYFTANSLAFPDFVSLVNPDFFKTVRPDNYRRWGRKIEYYLDIYLLTGGYISAVNDYQKNGAVRQTHYSNYLYWFLAYVSRLGRDPVLIRQIMEKIILNLGSPVGYKTLARKTKARTHLTAAEYLNLLEEMFVVKTIYQTEAGGRASRRAKKIYFRDPFLFWLFYAYVYGSLDYWRLARRHLHDRAVFSHLLENLVLSHLIKNEKNQISFWRDNIKKREINFLARRGGKLTPILIRYHKEIKPADYEIFKAAGFNSGIIISQNVLAGKGGIKVMPLSYFLTIDQT